MSTDLAERNSASTAEFYKGGKPRSGEFRSGVRV